MIHSTLYVQTFQFHKETIISIAAKFAKFTIRAILSSLAKEASKCERKVQYAVAKRDSKVATLDKEIIAMSKREDAIVEKIRQDAEAKVQKVLGAKHDRIKRKVDLHINCGSECRHLNKKGQDAMALKAKLEAVLK